MKFSVILLGAALSLFSSAEAGITTNTPFNTVTWSGGETETVAWDDDGKAPKLTQIGITSIDLMNGNATSQTFVANIGKAPATAKKINYKVPKDVGPTSDSYFIKYTAGDYTAFSGTFSIENVNGKLAAADPTAPTAKAPIDPQTPITTNPNAPNVAAPNTADPAAAPKSAPYGGSTPSSSSSSAAASPTGQNSLPEPISSSSSNLFPNFSGVATAAIALAFTYLY